ncbi:MAG: twin-arginine translocation signal domain-containing protein [Candidatus Thiodiazotropha sp.]
MNKKAKRYALDHNRRKFLRKSAGAGAGVALAASLPGLASSDDAEARTDEAQQQKGYRITPHIAAYYETMNS